MRISEFLAGNRDRTFSLEIIPPKRGGSASELLTAIEAIMPFGPQWIDVTSHGADVTWKPLDDGSYKRIIMRKRPGTLSLCAVIKYQFGVETVPHILCNGFSQDETEDSLIELNFLGIRNVLALRGDHSARLPQPEARINKTSTDLIEQIVHLNQGTYLEEFADQSRMDFEIGVAAYPEKHVESPNISFDLEILRKKQEMGVRFAISQMFFDTPAFLAWVARARDAGITIPLVPGIKIITSRRHITSLPKTFFVNIPDQLAQSLRACSTDAEVTEVGIAWAAHQVETLRKAGFNHLHFFLMQDVIPFKKLLDRI